MAYDVQLPFDDENVQMLFRKIKGGIFSLPIHLSLELSDLLNRMLQVDPVKRITIAQIRYSCIGLVLAHKPINQPCFISYMTFSCIIYHTGF